MAIAILVIGGLVVLSIVLLALYLKEREKRIKLESSTLPPTTTTTLSPVLFIKS